MFVEDSVVTCIKCIRKDPSVIKPNHKRNKDLIFSRNQLYTKTSCMATLNLRTSLFPHFNWNFKIRFCSKLWNFLYVLARDNDSLIMVVKCFSFDNQQQKYTKIETYK